MRLINTTSFELKVFMPEHVPDYVILSHRWSPDAGEEVTFNDFLIAPLLDEDNPARRKIGFEKVLGACKLARDDGYTWIWIDSCCMDKSSSSELQEAINSMWNFYSNANICYVYLEDVLDERAGWTDTFHESSWFDRGWTLQELIAPQIVEFYAADWSPIGTKAQRVEIIAARTLISSSCLLNPSRLDLKCSALRLSWAAHRGVTREEDQAYSLLGLFQVNMPMLYGEGRAKAFGRLQEAIYSATRDESLFLFRYTPYKDRLPLIADSPDRFCSQPGCPKCQQECMQCLPSMINYEEVYSSDIWARQAHEQLFTTITTARFEVSAVLMLLEAHLVYSQLKFPANLARVKEKATHVAVLNHTWGINRGDSLCLLLRRSYAGEDVTTRVFHYPVMVKNVVKLLPKANRRKVLFAFQRAENENPTSSTVSTTELAIHVVSDCCRILSWTANDEDINFPTLRERSAKCFIVRATDFQAQVAGISCEIAETDSSMPFTKLHLERNGDSWLMKSDADLLETPGAWGQDRCGLRTPDGRSFEVSIRRMPASRRPIGVDSQIRVAFSLSIKPIIENVMGG